MYDLAAAGRRELLRMCRCLAYVAEYGKEARVQGAYQPTILALQRCGRRQRQRQELIPL